MTDWTLKTISDSYEKTKEFRFNNYVVNPHIEALVGDIGGKSLLEVGCGFGRYLEIFNRGNPSNLVGCDVCEHQIELCNQNIKSKNLTLHTLDFCNEDTPRILGENEYDIVYNVFVILYAETLKKTKTFIENSYRCLKKGGKTLICTLDIATASSYPQVFDILNFPVKLLSDEKIYTDGCTVQIEITKDCIVKSYHRDFSTLKKLMEEVGFKNVRKSELFLDEVALMGFSKDELNVIKNSNILLLIEADK